MEDVNEWGKPKNPKRDTSIKAVKELATRAGLPFFGRRIASDFSWVIVQPANKWAFMYEPKEGFGNKQTEAEHVVWRHLLGGHAITKDGAQNIINAGIKNKLDVPESRSVMLSNMDDPTAIDRDIAKLDAVDLIKLATAIDRRLNAG